jgi:monoamine oxidase
VDEVDVAVVGAGAAGIAAARRIRATGRSVLLLEALPRLGGRGHTVDRAGFPLDLGCGWLHSARRNPLVDQAVAAGFAVEHTPPIWQQQYRDLGFSPADREAAHDAYLGLSGRLHDRVPGDRAAAAMGEDDRWRPFVDALCGFLSGAELDRLSARDILAYDDSATTDNWRLPRGYGALLAALGSDLPQRLGTTVRAIDHRAGGVRLETDAGTLRAGAAIVTVSSAVLASGAIRFEPAVDDHLHAAAGLPLGLANKLFLAMADEQAVPPDTHLIGNPHRADTGSYHLRPFGRPMVECFFGGKGARAIEAAGPGAGEALAREELGRLLGGTFAAGLSPIVETAWGREPTVLGSYSHARPGRADARAVLAAPASERLHFAGEACSPHDFSTAHGAWASGLVAADRVIQATVPA